MEVKKVSTSAIIGEGMQPAKMVAVILISSILVTCAYGDGEGDTDVFTKIMQSIVTEVENVVRAVSNMVLRAALRILGFIYAPMAIVGMILYATRIDRYLGKELVGGALLLAFFAEFVLPALL